MIIEEKNPQAEERANKLGKDMCISLLREKKPVCLNASGWSMYPFVKDKKNDIIQGSNCRRLGTNEEMTRKYKKPSDWLRERLPIGTKEVPTKRA